MSEALARSVLAGQYRALAQAVSLVERDDRHAEQLLADIYPATGRARIIGITGSPGAGKSTLVASLTKHYRKQDKKVGIIAVDPTSPFTGGAILGDRPGADPTSTEITMMMSLVEEHGDWIPPIVKTVASTNKGIEDLDAALGTHFEHLKTSGELDRRNRERVRIRIETMLKEKFMD